MTSKPKARAPINKRTGPGPTSRGRARPKDRVRAQISDWHHSEDLYFREVYNAPSLYTISVRLARALADNLANITEVDALVDTYQQGDAGDIDSLIDDLELPYTESLDYDLARDVAFYMRYREIVEARTQTECQARVAKARAEGVEWVVLFGDEVRNHGRAPVERLEMHLPDGISLHVTMEETDDLERGYVYVIEPIVLDPDTGQVKHDAPSPGPAWVYSTREEVTAALAALRVQYSTGRVQSENE